MLIPYPYIACYSLLCRTRENIDACSARPHRCHTALWVILPTASFVLFVALAEIETAVGPIEAGYTRVDIAKRSFAKTSIAETSKKMRNLSVSRLFPKTRSV